jgi:hypothetical protein
MVPVRITIDLLHVLYSTATVKIGGSLEPTTQTNKNDEAVISIRLCWYYIFWLIVDYLGTTE